MPRASETRDGVFRCPGFRDARRSIPLPPASKARHWATRGPRTRLAVEISMTSELFEPLRRLLLVSRRHSLPAGAPQRRVIQRTCGPKPW